MFGGGDANPRDPRFGGEVFGQTQSERFHVVDRIAPRERVDRILHRVGREAAAVVAVDVDGVERAFELDVQRQIHDLVRRRRRRTAHLHEADARFAVAVPGQLGIRISTPPRTQRTRRTV